MSVVGRPRGIRSRGFSGIGGRPLTESEKVAVLRIARRRGWTLDDETDEARNKFLEEVFDLHARYEATAGALGKQVGIVDELRDMDSLRQEAIRLLELVTISSDQVDPYACIAPAGKLIERLNSFQGLIWREMVELPEGMPYLRALARLRDNLIYVRWWPERRSQLEVDLRTVIATLDALPEPSRMRAELGFKKSIKEARNGLEKALEALYCAQLHPLRMRDWEEAQRAHRVADPPPAAAHNAFAREVMKALGVPFESRPRKA